MIQVVQFVNFKIKADENTAIQAAQPKGALLSKAPNLPHLTIRFWNRIEAQEEETEASAENQTRDGIRTATEKKGGHPVCEDAGMGIAVGEVGIFDFVGKVAYLWVLKE